MTLEGIYFLFQNAAPLSAADHISSLTPEGEISFSAPCIMQSSFWVSPGVRGIILGVSGRTCR